MTEDKFRNQRCKMCDCTNRHLKPDGVCRDYRACAVTIRRNYHERVTSR